MPAPTFVRGGSDGATSATTSRSLSVDCTDGDCLVVFATSRSGGQPTSATYNGVSMTKHSGASSSTTNVTIFTLLAPATGTNTLTVNSSNGRLGMQYSVWDGVDSINNDGTYNGNDKSSAPVTITSATDEVVAAGFVKKKLGTVTQGTGMTDIANFGWGTGSDWWRYTTGTSYKAGAASVTTDWTFATSGDVAAGAIGLVGAAGGVSHEGEATIAAVSSTTSSGEVARTGSASIDPSSTVTATGSLNRGGEATIAASSSVTALGSITKHGDATVASVSTLTADGEVDRTGAASVSSTSTLTASGTVTTAHEGSASITAVSSLTASAEVVTAHEGEATIAAVSSVTADAVVVTAHEGQASVDSTSSVTASGELELTGAATVGATSAVSADGAMELTGAATVTATSTVDVLGKVSAGAQDVRTFDGVNDTLRASIGGATATGDMSMFAVVKLLPDGGNRVFAEVGQTNGRLFRLGLNGADVFTIRIGATDKAHGSIAFDDTDGYVLVGFTREGGTTTPRGHFTKLDSLSWTHADFSGTMADPTNPPNNTVSFGQDFGSSRDCACEIAAVGFFDSELSDADVELLADGLTEWQNHADIAALWRLGDDPMDDLTGGGADETAVTGDTAIVGGVDQAEFDLSTAVAHQGTAAVVASSSFSADGELERTGQASITAVSSVTADGAVTTAHEATAAVDAVSTLTADGAVERTSSATIAAVSSVTADGEVTAAGASVEGQASVASTSTVTAEAAVFRGGGVRLWDDFDRADTTDPTTVPVWENGATLVSGDVTPELEGNELAKPTDWSYASLKSSVDVAADVIVQITLNSDTGAQKQLRIFARGQSDGSGYFAYMDDTFAGLRYYNGTSESSKGSVSHGRTFAGGDRVAFVVEGDRFEIWHEDPSGWARVYEATDSTLDAPGRVGIRPRMNGSKWDDFSVSEVPPEGASITATSSLTASAETFVIHEAEASVEAVSSVTADGRVDTYLFGQASVTTSSSVTAEAKVTRDHVASASVSITSSSSATGALAAVGTATITTYSFLTAAAFDGRGSLTTPPDGDTRGTSSAAGAGSRSTTSSASAASRGTSGAAGADTRDSLTPAGASAGRNL